VIAPVDGSNLSIARQLRGFGIKPAQLKIERVNRRGYERADFEDAFSRYTPPDAPVSATDATSAQPSEKQADSIRCPEGAGSGSENGANPHEQMEVVAVADETAGPGETQKSGNIAAAPPPPLSPEQDAAIAAHFADGGT
jgi:uncharacterized protein DUF3631